MSQRVFVVLLLMIEYGSYACLAWYYSFWWCIPALLGFMVAYVVYMCSVGEEEGKDFLDTYNRIWTAVADSLVFPIGWLARRGRQ